MRICTLIGVRMRPPLMAVVACALCFPSVAEGQAVRSATIRPIHAEYGSVTMARTTATTCPTGESGFRRQVFTVDFARRFTSNNFAVTLGIRGLDAGPWVRISSYVQAKTATNMTIVAETWCTTTIASAVIDYMAVGE
jgi:hypothetical protein